MKTTHLGLTLTSSSETDMTFLEWRTLMNGTGSTSNMQLIDSAIQELQETITKDIDYAAELQFNTDELVTLN